MIATYDNSKSFLFSQDRDGLAQEGAIQAQSGQSGEPRSGSRAGKSQGMQDIVVLCQIPYVLTFNHFC